MFGAYSEFHIDIPNNAYNLDRDLSAARVIAQELTGLSLVKSSKLSVS
jgi:hypothetical protein